MLMKARQSQSFQLSTTFIQVLFARRVVTSVALHFTVLAECLWSFSTEAMSVIRVSLSFIADGVRVDDL